MEKNEECKTFGKLHKGKWLQNDGKCSKANKLKNYTMFTLKKFKTIMTLWAKKSQLTLL